MEQGKVRAIGASNYSPERLSYAVTHHPKERFGNATNGAPINLSNAL
jgi:hypothetical protein